MKRAADDAVEAPVARPAPVPQQATGDRVSSDDVTDDEAIGPDPEDSAGAEQTPAPESGLGDRQLQILEFEKRWWRHAGSKEQAIRDAFELSPTRYYQLLNALLDEPAALEHDPALIQRLRRMRATRTRSRRPTD